MHLLFYSSVFMPYLIANKFSVMKVDCLRNLNDLFMTRQTQKKNLDGYLSEISKKSTGIANTTLNKLRRIKHRRKFQTKEDIKMFESQQKLKEINPQTSKERFSLIIATPGRQSQMSMSKRNTCPFISSEREQDGVKVPFLKALSKGLRKTNQIEKSQSYDVRQKVRVETKCQFRPRHLKNKLSEGQNSQLFKKNSTLFNRISSEFHKPKQEESLLNLIQKFKFDNLKEVKNISPQSSQPNTLDEKPLYNSAKHYIQFEPFGGEAWSQKDDKDRRKANKTANKMSLRVKMQSTVKRKVSVICPWEMGIEDQYSNELNQ